jgi:hypothetical protein
LADRLSKEELWLGFGKNCCSKQNQVCCLRIQELITIEALMVINENRFGKEPTITQWEPIRS